MAKAQSRRGTMVVDLVQALRHQIEQGQYPVGTRLPSETLICQEFGVSRTVVREAVAALRADGMVQPRQGAGVYVLKDKAGPPSPFAGIDRSRISSVIELLELRTAVEVEAAGLAALRRTALQLDRIDAALDKVARLVEAEALTAEADFDFHQAIAAASNNSRFVEFLSLLGVEVIPRRALKTEDRERLPKSYWRKIVEEHRAIVSAIRAGDRTAAQSAMRAHLEGSQSRYRDILSGIFDTPERG